ncbi:hypothetical protein M8C21_027466 [Ambrosia artemisiifolia]|uniref:Uncharacterized protein n=1 Tax=Ambrosia artemisiifolia TaxID=4212 RepID=A0AAD5BPD0_AMBAR|nr:hypothetical protein M8C21_027466 [Ambrosia artemisiifolia]
MGYLQSSSTSGGVGSHLYSQALQMKLYQAFIFSIPILFSIILFLLFYLFYLKRTYSNNNSSSSSIFHLRASRTQDSSTISQCSEMGSKLNLEDKLTVISFDEDLYAKELICSVVNTSKGSHHEPLVVFEPPTVNAGSNPQGFPLEHSVVIFEGSSSSSMDNKLSQPNEESVVVNVQIHDS